MALGIMGAKSKIHSWEDTQISFVCRPPFFAPLEEAVGGLCCGVFAFSSDDKVLRPSHKDFKNHASNECPFGETRNGDYRLYEHKWVIDATQGPSSALDHQRRTVRFELARVYEILEGKPKLLFDANLYKLENIEAPEWATKW